MNIGIIRMRKLASRRVLIGVLVFVVVVFFSYSFWNLTSMYNELKGYNDLLLEHTIVIDGTVERISVNDPPRSFIFVLKGKRRGEKITYLCNAYNPSRAKQQIAEHDLKVRRGLSNNLMVSGSVVGYREEKDGSTLILNGCLVMFSRTLN